MKFLYFENMDPEVDKKPNFFKKLWPKRPITKMMWVAIIFVLVLLIINIGFGIYQKWQTEKRIDELNEELLRIEQEIYDARAADVVGGATPQETLEMFIAAVEAGDYEQASKYFVVEKQEQWKKDLQEVGEAQNLNGLLDPLIDVKDSDGNYSDRGDQYFIHKPILVSFVLYPSDNWKIEDI